MSTPVERIEKVADQLAQDQKHLWAWWHDVCKLAMKNDGTPLPSMPDSLAIITHRLGAASGTLRQVARLMETPS